MEVGWIASIKEPFGFALKITRNWQKNALSFNIHPGKARSQGENIF